MSAIYVMWMRQVKRQFRSTPRLIASFAQPLLFLIAFGFGFSSIFAKAGAGNYIQFVVPGMIGMTLIFSSIFTGIEIISDRQFGFLKETLVAPVERWKIMLGRTLGGVTISVLQGLVVLFASYAFGFRPELIGIPMAIVFMILISLFFTSLGTAIATKVSDMQGFPLLMNLLVMPLFFLSGALFPLDAVPQAMKVVAYIDPLSYGIDGLRGVLTGLYHLNLIIDFGVIAFLTAVIFVIGTYLFSKMEA
jgi:ABC-2 type transport system permease protein